MSLSDNLVKINLLRKGLDELRPLSKQAQDKLWEKLRLEWNYNSNHIEGNTLTYGETKLLLLFDKTTGDHEKREYDEMEAHDVAIHLIREWAADKDRDLTEGDIKNLNEIILVKPYWKEALTYDGQQTRRLIKVGGYKEYPNSVRLKTGEMFHYALPEETPRMMQELIDWYRTTEIQHPLYLASEFHYKFIRIHPFDDGNGRIARLLVNYVLMKHGYTPIIIKSADKENYLTALQKADAGDKAAFPNYMAEQLIWSLELEEKAANGESIEELDDLDKEIFIWKKQLKKEERQPQAKSDDQIVELFIKCLNSLFHKFHTKMHNAFYDVFLEWEEIGWVNNANSEHQGMPMIETKMRRVSEMLADPSRKILYKDEKGIHSIALDIHLKGFRNDGTNTFNTTARIGIDFEQYKYILNINHKSKTEKLYNELISPREQDEIINEVVKETLSAIKKMMKKK